MDGRRRVSEPVAPRGRGASARSERAGGWAWLGGGRPRRRAAGLGGRNPIGRARLIGRLGLLTFFASTLTYGVIIGGHGPAVSSAFAQTPDIIASVAGFRIESIAVTGQMELTTEEIVDAVGLDATRSLVFLDATIAREQLLALPLVESATVRKFYPDRVEIAITERKPYAVWQHEGSFSVISADGTSIDSARDGRFSHLPLVVGEGADTASVDFLPVLAKFPEVKKNTYGAVRIGDRRWNLRLNNGFDVKLPDEEVEVALAKLDRMIREGNIMSRDLVSIDLRDDTRTLVRLSAEAAKTAREAAAKTKKAGGQT